MKFCYRCQEPLTGLNISEEHIILNACGGKLKSADLLCKKCNEEFGSGYDALLARQTSNLANLLHIRRDRDEPVPIEGKIAGTGEGIVIPLDGPLRKADPKFIKRNVENGISISIEARSEKELRKMLTGLKKKHPFVDVEELIQSATRTKGYLNDYVALEEKFGGDDAFRSIAKSAINFFIFKGGDRKYITHLFPFLIGDNMPGVVWYHYPEHAYYEFADLEVSHIIKLVGNPKEGLLYCYIELFNCHNYIVLLNDHYDGQVIDETYIYELLELKMMDKPLDLVYDRTQLSGIFKLDLSHFLKFVQQRLQRVVGIADQNMVDRHLEKLYEETWLEAMKDLPEGALITEKEVNQLATLLAEKMVAFIEHRGKGRHSMGAI